MDFKPRDMKRLYIPTQARSSNESQIRVMQDLEQDGWHIQKRGWPDFIATRADEARVIEVKSVHGIGLTSTQATMADILQKHFGVEVEVVVPSDVPLLRPEAISAINENHLDEYLKPLILRPSIRHITP